MFSVVTHWYGTFKKNQQTSTSLILLRNGKNQTQILALKKRLNLVFRNLIFNPLKFETSWYGINDRKQTCKYYVNFGSSNS